MKVALIPPCPFLPIFGNAQFHLLLAHLFSRSSYVKHYKKQRLHGAYLILDNSAHEKGEGEDSEILMLRAMDVQAQEVVIPDALEDAEGTVEACLSAHETWYEGSYSGMRELDPTLMYVPQGKNADEWNECFRSLVRIHNFCAKRHRLRRDFVLGLSKDYEVWPGGLRELIEKYILPVKRELLLKDIHMHLHMLGWGRNLWMLNEIARDHPWIRSTDSAKPFVYAINGIELRPPEVPEYPKRRWNYFSTTKMDTDICATNILAFIQCARGEL